MINIKTTATIALLSAVGAPSAFAQNANVQSGMMSTPEFVRAAAQSEEFEIQEGRLAEKKGNADLRRFGAKMVHDHTMTTNDLPAAIKKAGMDVPPPPALRLDQKEMMTKLEGLGEKSFDKTYVEQQVMSHREALRLHEAYAKDAPAGPIKMAATKAIPIVREHLQMIEGMAGGKRPAM